MIGADGRQYGPVAADQLRQWIAEGRANAETRVAVEGSAEWKPLGSVPEFSLLFAAKLPPTIAPIAPPASALARKSHPLALAGFLMGLLSFLFCCCHGLPFNLLGLVLSIVALVQIRNSPQQYTGEGLAIAGMVLSILSILLVVAWMIFVSAAAWNEGPHRGYRY
jgi:hypothetical protein